MRTRAFKPVPHNSLDTVLIFRIGSLGDTVVALPCFHQVARAFPLSRRIVVTDRPISQKVSSVESVIGASGLIDGAIYFPAPRRRLNDLLALRAEIKATGATMLVYVADRTMGYVLRDILFFYGCGIRRVIGAPLSRDLRQLYLDHATGDTEREAERLARCLAPLGAIDLADPRMWNLRLQPDECDAAQDALAPLQGHAFVAFSIGGKVAEKDWGDDNWSHVLAAMRARYPELALVLIGSADESARATALAARFGGETLDLCGRLTPRESAAVMGHALFYLGHDCGPMHLAAAAGIPCIAVFGAVNMPKWWHPMGPHHHVLHDMSGVRNIAPDAVLGAIESMMDRAALRVRTAEGDQGARPERG